MNRNCKAFYNTYLGINSEEFMFNFKKILAALTAIMLVIGMLPFGAFAENVGAKASEDDLLIRIGTVSDSHVDYNIQNKEPYIRNAFVKAVNAL